MVPPKPVPMTMAVKGFRGCLSNGLFRRQHAEPAATAPAAAPLNASRRVTDVRSLLTMFASLNDRLLRSNTRALHRLREFVHTGATQAYVIGRNSIGLSTRRVSMAPSSTLGPVRRRSDRR